MGSSPSFQAFPPDEHTLVPSGSGQGQGQDASAVASVESTEDQSPWQAADQDTGNVTADDTELAKMDQQVVQKIEQLLRENPDLTMLTTSQPSIVKKLTQLFCSMLEGRTMRDAEIERALAQAESLSRALSEKNQRLAAIVADCNVLVRIWGEKLDVPLDLNNLDQSLWVLLSILDCQLHHVDSQLQERDLRIAALEKDCAAGQLAVEAWKAKAKKALCQVEKDKTLVIVMELDPPTGTKTTTVFEVMPDGALSNLGSPFTLTSNWKMTPVSSSKRRLVDGEKLSEVQVGSNPWNMTIDLAAHGCPMPDTRAAALSQFADVPVGYPASYKYPSVFSRASIAAILGGSKNNHHVTVTLTKTKFAEDYGIDKYSVMSMERDPWSPSGPGKHGYWIRPAKARRTVFAENEERHVFVGTDDGVFHYCGYYRITPFGKLSRDEWASLPHHHKLRYARLICPMEDYYKEHEATSTQDVIDQFDQGVHRAPLLRLQCLRFDGEFYADLCRANDVFLAGQELEFPPRPKKRQRTADREFEGDEFKGQEERGS